MRPDDYSPPRAIPLSERLPEDHEATEDGEVWVEEPGGSYPLGDTGDYDWEPHRWILCQIEPRHERMNYRWLPHWALPRPTAP